MEDVNRTIEALTSMIEVNNKRRQVYQVLAQKSRHTELRSLFTRYSDQSKEFSSELSTWRAAYGGFGMPRNGGNILARLGSFIGHWINKNVASRCEEMEIGALKLYRGVMEKSFLVGGAAKDIEHQSKEFEKALVRLRSLRQQAGSRGSAGEELVHSHAF